MRFGTMIAAAAALLCAAPSNAALLRLSYLPSTNLGKAFEFTVTTYPTILSTGTGSFTAAIDNGAGIYQGKTSEIFFTTNFFGGFGQYGGDQVFQNTNLAPRFDEGVFSIYNGSITGDQGILRITAVPEPVSWALMIIGMGAIGASVRRSRRGKLRAA